MAVNSPTEKQQKLGQIALDEQVTEATEIEELTISEEDSILLCVQYIFKSGGIDRSVASIREIADISEGPFDFQNAVSALRNMEYIDPAC